MINFKTVKFSCVGLAFLTLGLSGCYMDDPNNPNMYYSSRSKAVHNAKQVDTAGTVTTAKAQTTSKSESSKGPVQKTTPGPKRVAAPQLPVIQ